MPILKTVVLCNLLLFQLSTVYGQVNNNPTKKSSIEQLDPLRLLELVDSLGLDPEVIYQYADSVGIHPENILQYADSIGT
ncbi:MAG: hypothetical protein NWS46_08610, partial [Cyclobacteriaceae bacterium]|nr:hypothetical protein [Cyclobacteriaceae bacterium]